MANINADHITIGSDTLVLQDADLRSKKVNAFQNSPDDNHYPSEKLVKDSLDAKLNSSEKGANNGVASLDSTGKVPSSQLPTIPDVSTTYDTGDTAETTLDDADYVPFYDTSASGRRKTLWRNIKAKLKSYFDSFYLTAHQDISGKANSEDLAEVAFSGDYEDLTNKPTIPAVVSGINDGTNWTSLTIGSVTKNIPSGGGGGLTNYDFTHTANTTVSTSTTVTFAANTRCSRMVSASADLSITFAVNNSSDNYLWIKNTGSSDIDILINSVTYNNSSVSNVYTPNDGISVPAGKVCEIGIVCNADGAFITSRSDLSL